MRRRYGDEFHRHVEQAFEREGLVYNPPADVVSNSRAALRLTEVARSEGRHEAAHDRLMRAYWEDGLDIGDLDVLRELAAELALDDAEAAIAGDLHADRVAWFTGQAQAAGIHAIPAFLLDRRLIVLGAQPDEVFAQAVERLGTAADDARPA